MILLIDNYGASTFTLRHQLISLGVEVEVVRNEIATPEKTLKKRPKTIVISPGPGDPAEAGNLVEIIRHCAGEIPVLGIALGLHVIALAFGGKIAKGERVVHGKQSEVIHDARTIFEGIPSPMLAGRYDSLVVQENGLPSELRISAHTREGEIMALRGKTGLLEGVQFHPESILTPRGDALLFNFLEMAGIL